MKIAASVVATALTASLMSQAAPITTELTALLEGSSRFDTSVVRSGKLVRRADASGTVSSLDKSTLQDRTDDGGIDSVDSPVAAAVGQLSTRSLEFDRAQAQDRLEARAFEEAVHHLLNGLRPEDHQLKQDVESGVIPSHLTPQQAQEIVEWQRRKVEWKKDLTSRAWTDFRFAAGGVRDLKHKIDNLWFWQTWSKDSNPAQLKAALQDAENVRDEKEAAYDAAHYRSSQHKERLAKLEKSLASHAARYRREAGQDELSKSHAAAR